MKKFIIAIVMVALCVAGVILYERYRTKPTVSVAHEMRHVSPPLQNVRDNFAAC